MPRTSLPPTVDLGIPRPSLSIVPPQIVPAAEADRRGARRHRIQGTTVRVRIEGSNEPRGRLRDISVTGSVFIETRTPFDLKQTVRLTMALPTGHTMSFEGRVVRSTAEGMAALLEVDDAGQAFLNVFVSVACQSPRTRGLDVTIAKTREESSALIELSRKWHNVLLDEKNDAAHQRFIEACLAAKRVDHAVSCYRALNERRGGDRRIEAYLQQVGTILQFAAFQTVKPAAKKLRIPAPIALIAVLFCALAGLFVFLSNQG